MIIIYVESFLEGKQLKRSSFSVQSHCLSLSFYYTTLVLKGYDDGKKHTKFMSIPAARLARCNNNNYINTIWLRAKEKWHIMRAHRESATILYYITLVAGGHSLCSRLPDEKFLSQPVSRRRDPHRAPPPLMKK